jgi:hypothetical protein
MRLWVAVFILAGGLSPDLYAATKLPKSSKALAKTNRLVAPVRDADRPLKVFEVRVNTQMEWLVLEQLMLGSDPTHFLKYRKGNRTKAISVIRKSDFDRWSNDILAIKTGRQPACVVSYEAMAVINGQKMLNRFCPGSSSDPAVKNLEKSTDEMLAYIRRNDALKPRAK